MKLPNFTPERKQQETRVVGDSSRRPRMSILRYRVDVILAALDFLFVAVGLSVLWHSTVEALVAGAVVVLLIELAGHYQKQITLSALDEIPRLAGTCIIAIFLITVLFDVETTTLEIFTRALLLFAALFALRVIYYGVRRRRRARNITSRSRTVIIGGGVVAAELIERIAEHPEFGLEPVAVIDQDPLFDTRSLRIPVIADVSLRELVVRERVGTVIVAFTNAADSALVSPLRECGELDCEIYIVPRLFEFTHLSADMDRIHTIPLMKVRRNAYRSWYWRCKRVFDCTAAMLALVLLSPLMAAAALAVYLGNRRAPIIFRQVRVGRHSKEFTLYKFRSMNPVAASASDKDWNPGTASPRLNTVGRILRKTSIDELPQLWNVVRGDMSLVGPRPERPHFVEQFRESVTSYGDRHRVDVGLTGWAAINGLRGDTSIRDRALYDNFYIENWSVWLDIKIIILTIRAVVRGTGS
ncbi:sugar transferase [Gordonia rubripertincta]|uniref:Sugar transferase n=1 Tax=Gordonia rubripertincta TaxID=36822 RepID=A0ABT4MXR3_GORRU|nr:sugar transferase [Gordonia rubripertincta]MCZ4551781.1 sugar transferase [Gordonia rubripertincta]